jgi:hypothetical protein
MLSWHFWEKVVQGVIQALLLIALYAVGNWLKRDWPRKRAATSKATSVLLRWLWIGFSEIVVPILVVVYVYSARQALFLPLGQRSHFRSAFYWWTAFTLMAMRTGALFIAWRRISPVLKQYDREPRILVPPPLHGLIVRILWTAFIYWFALYVAIFGAFWGGE